jgi:hypothetical protein
LLRNAEFEWFFEEKNPSLWASQQLFIWSLKKQTNLPFGIPKLSKPFLDCLFSEEKKQVVLYHAFRVIIFRSDQLLKNNRFKVYRVYQFRHFP